MAMREVEFFFWMLPPDPTRRRTAPYRSRWAMTREDAAHIVGATPITASREVRLIPETAAESDQRIVDLGATLPVGQPTAAPARKNPLQPKGHRG